MAEKMTKTPPPYQPSYELFGVLNPNGHLWSHQTFFTREEARRYVASFWKGRPEADLDKFKIVPVRMMLELHPDRALDEASHDAR